MSDFDLRVISLGAGVQSTAMYIMACDGEFGVVPDVAIFADTQDERPATMEWLEMLESIGSIPIVRATRGKLSAEVLRSMWETPSGFCPIPTYVKDASATRESQGRRQCTRSHKLDVINRAIRERLGVKPGAPAPKGAAEVWIGISTDEASRAKPSRYSVSVNRFPLLYDRPMRRGECAEFVKARLGSVPPKSSCYYCPFRSDADWIAMKHDDPDSFAAAVRFERVIRAIDDRQFLHDSCKPLDQAPLDSARTLDMFDGACTEGMCGV